MQHKAVKWAIVGVGLMTLALAVAACGAGSAGSGEPEGVTVNVKMTEFAFEMDKTEVPAGVPVTFNITNEGAVEHEVVLEVAGVNDEPLENPDGSEAEAEDIEPGGTAKLTYTFDEGGSFQLGCHIPGHYEAGMVKEFTVSG